MDRNLTRYGQHGWMFRANDALGRPCEYRTNDKGEGLWVRRGDEWRQVSGTSQYRLPHDEQAAAAQIEGDQTELEAL